MKHISFALLALATTSINAAQPVNTNPCYAAGEAQNYTAVLSECPALAVENDMFAHFFMATAIINSKTRLFDSELSADERAQRTFKLPTEEKIAISDAKQHLEAAVEQGHTNSHFVLGYILLETKLNMLPPSGRLDLQIDQAEQLLLSAASRGDAEADYMLARLAKNHKNQTKALEHYTAAATKGYARAMLWLGEHFACKKNNDTAYNWLQKAKAAGDRDAQDAIDELNTYGDLTNCVK